MFDFRKVEQDTLRFWKENKIFEKSLENRKKAKRFVFWEGPPTANGLPHIGHFLTRVYKDVYGRYKTMRGFYVLRKAGWDTHGLPVEIEVEKELGFKNKKDIEKFGIAEFNKKAKASVWKYKAEWEEMTRRTGFWLDTDNPYITYENKYIESLWAIIKKIWDKKLLYLAHRVVPFCTRCGTPLSSHEVAQGYKTVTDKSVTVKFLIFNPKSPVGDLGSPLRDFEFLNKLKIPKNSKLYILAWTTTPWTLPGNVALAVGKDIEYVVVEQNGENYILAKDLVEKVFEPTTYNLQPTTYKGSALVGLEYEPLFDIKELKSEKSYRIYDSDFVSTEEGTGVVHTAVMYGEDDYELGTKIGLPKFHTVDEQGRFVGVSPELDGKYVKDPETEELVIRQLEIRNLLLKVENFEHDYPFCWRCDTPLIYYAKESWFIKMSALRDKLLKNNSKVNWTPEHIKEGRFGQWLKEGKDWAFSRERYWGTPLPIWKCGSCGEFLTVGSMDELDKYRYKPKNEFYILRHGHSEKNGEEGREIISSKVEADKYHLTKNGVEQIQKVVKQLKKLGGVDRVIASPFIRTQETAKIVAEELGLKVQTEPLLGEFQHGVLCEGMTHAFCVANHMANQGWETKTADGESWKDVRRRMS
ncbi:MAG: class I tRNA ligase family protein, partial [Candidatus Yanofskybacteria bacterium]|nr:class I tRNA ligase family protein [Candidatus Yanofskybacteria bacterium]